jgi:predicted DNA-binding transcriptional regulator YafY
VGLYANSGLWYCPAYCFSREAYRVFRFPLGAKEKADVHLGNWREMIHGGPGEAGEGQTLAVYAELTREGVQRCQRELWLASSLHVRPDGTGYLEGDWPRRDRSFFARFFVGLGAEAVVERPAELIEAVRSDLAFLIERYCADTE